jgi:hypothetical protein
VQIVHSSRRGSRDIEHIGSAHDDAELELLKAAARQRLAAGQGELDLGLDAAPEAGGPLEITSSRMGHLWDGLSRAYDALGFDEAAGGDEVFRQLVLARIIEPTSKLDSLRVLAEAGIAAASYPTLNRRLPAYAAAGWREALAAACARRAGLGPASLVLYDVSTLYFETDAGDGFREPGFSKERRLEPQITIGLLTDASGFPLMVNAFDGNRAETTTMLPTIKAFMAAHQLADVVIVADAGMVSEGNKQAIEAEGLSFILGAKVPQVPFVIEAWRKRHPDHEIPDGAYHRLFQIEKSFRMSKSDLAARPIYHRKRDSVEAHLTIVFAALAVSRFIEEATGWSIKKFVKTTRRYRTIEIQAGGHTITAADPLPDDLKDALKQIQSRPSAH